MKRLIFPCDGQWTQQILAHNVKREVTPLLLSLSNPCMHRACLLKIKPAICLVSGEESTKDFSHANLEVFTCVDWDDKTKFDHTS